MIGWIRQLQILQPAMLALAGYAALCCGLVGVTVTCLTSAIKLAVYSSGSDEPTPIANRQIPGSAALFVQGSSVSIARAELLKRVSIQISSTGGNIVSSSLDQATNAGQRTATVKTDFTTENAQLQKLLYSLESGTPFLFVDRLTVRSDPQSNTPHLLRVEMTVSGIWRETEQ